MRTRPELRNLLLLGVLGTGILLATGCGPAPEEGEEAPADEETEMTMAGEAEAPAAALERISGDDLREDIRVLASDSFGGRAPASPGGERTVRHLVKRFREIGLQPGNGDSWTQEVPLVSLTADPGMTLTISGAGRGGAAGGDAARGGRPAAEGGADGEAEPLSLDYGSGFMAWTKRVVDRVELDASEMVFVGYGIVAPEYGWDDYEGVDAEGKTVVMLVNDPGYATGDTALFNGRAMTYYGRWTYKYEEAARQGAAGALIVHETGPAGYPWEVVSGSWSGPQFDLVSEDGNAGRVAVEGWLTLASAGEVFDRAGLEYEALKERALARDFEAVPMGLAASVEVRNEIRRSTSRNVLATLPGTDLGDEYVVYMAHWDHLGTDPSLEDDSIYNGALDNATGTAGLLELAEAFGSLEERPRRSLLFLAVTAEEQGLLGSKHYAAHPARPLARTVAAINMDGLNIWGPTRDVTVVGHGMSELDDVLAAAAGAQGRTVRPDPEPEKGFYYRSDHFEFAKVGVPALYTDVGIDMVEGGEEAGRAAREAYTEESYHKPSDEYDPEWNLEGAGQDLRLLFRVGWRLARESTYPNWREGTEFRATRDSVRANAPCCPTEGAAETDTGGGDGGRLRTDERPDVSGGM